MKIHREGKNIIRNSFFILAVATFALLFFGPHIWWYQGIISIAVIVFYILIIRFFRVPNREFIVKDGHIMSPADGKIVIIQEVFEDEYIKEKCLQISVFMSPYNVHINWFPFKGKVRYHKYHPGKYLVAWHPKSSLLNERTSICIENENKQLVMLRQIAGAVARRIVCYAKVGQEVNQNDEVGFIKFGSRVDVYLPITAKPLVSIDEKVVGGRTILAKF